MHMYVCQYACVDIYYSIIIISDTIKSILVSRSVINIDIFKDVHTEDSRSLYEVMI